MHTTEGPATAGKQLLLAPDATGTSPADHHMAPVEPRDLDRSTPDDPTATTEPMATAATDKAQMLARLVAEGRQPRARRFTELEPYRDVLLTERRTGASIKLLAQSLAKLGVKISEETLRVWLLRQNMPKRRRTRKSPGAAIRPLPAKTPEPMPAAVAPYVPSWKRKGPRIARDDY